MKNLEDDFLFEDSENGEIFEEETDVIDNNDFYSNLESNNMDSDEVAGLNFDHDNF